MTRFLHRIFRVGRPTPSSRAPIPTTFGQRLDAARMQQPEHIRTIECYRLRSFG
ncbi:MAG: hypothetical protein QOI21_5830 [Actinomycetota bacterium]|jgi:hypothetical protein|nr:hypothetical protein [Actinomycetota bacterium]